MQNDRVVLDTNSLLVSLSRRGSAYPVWKGFQEGRYTLCVTTEIDPYFHMGLITADPDDNKFVDCAFTANATYIVSDDSHYDVLRNIPFPRILVLRLQTFIEKLKQ